MNGNPYPPPAPYVLVEMLRIHAWDEQIDDHTRKLIEWAADSLAAYMARCVALAQANEQLEARR